MNGESARPWPARCPTMVGLKALALATLLLSVAAGCALPSGAGYFFSPPPPPECPHGRHRHFVLSLEATAELDSFYVNGTLGTYSDPYHRRRSPEATVDFLCTSALFPGLMVDFVQSSPGLIARNYCIGLLR